MIINLYMNTEEHNFKGVADRYMSYLIQTFCCYQRHGAECTHNVGHIYIYNVDRHNFAYYIAANFFDTVYVTFPAAIFSSILMKPCRDAAKTIFR